MAHTAADGSKWSNAAQARKVPGRAQGDGKQPVSKFSKPEPARSSTATGTSAESEPGQDQDPSAAVATHGPAQHVEIDHAEEHHVHSEHEDGHKHHSKHASAEEAHAAAATLSGVAPQLGQEAPGAEGNPAQAMM